MFTVSVCETRSKHTEGEVSDLVFYAQSTVILGGTEGKKQNKNNDKKRLL